MPAFCLQQSKMARISGLSASKMGTGGFQKVLNAPALSREQEKVLKVVLSGTSVFFTGSAGTGKSFLLKRIIGNSFIPFLLIYITHYESH